MTSRFLFRPASTVGRLGLCVLLPLVLTGCGDLLGPGPMSYVISPDLQTKLGDKPGMTPEERTKAEESRKKVREELVNQFGPDPQHIKVPKGAGLPGGGIYLASHLEEEPGKVKRIQQAQVAHPDQVSDQEGGYGLYRRHCLHCHGVKT